ncbi:sugar ABC transporter substrate-binding protein [Leucobacter sp. USHLN153]|uniref:sugar ABC transporter substrate-binding protein n=1 Tax=Leucobacter sp. USHLN153 TaxID=3081268 RepID=UPI003015C9F5
MRIRSRVLGGTALVLALALSGCSGSSDAGGSGDEGVSEEAQAIVDAAKQEIDSYKEVPSSDDLGEPIDVSSLKGETIFSIPIDARNEFYQESEPAMAKIAEKAGVKYTTFPADGTQTSYQQGFAQAIAQDASVILLNGPLPETLEPQIKEATEAGIPVVPLHLSDSEEEPLEATPYEAFAPFNLGARLSTLYAVQDLKGEPVKALVIEVSSTGPSDGMVKTIEDVLANEAPEGSEISEKINSQVSDWSTEVQGAVQSALLKDPEINAVIPIYDSIALFAIPGIQQAEGDRNIGVYSFNGTTSVLGILDDGVMRVNVAENPDWVSYVNLDTAFRAMLDSGPSDKASGPVRVIDKSNLSELGDPPVAGKGFGDEYQGAFLAMWGIEE